MTFKSAVENPINVVRPQHLQVCAADQAAAAQLVYNGGPLIPNVDIVSIFWGTQWATDPAHIALMNMVEMFLFFVPTSSMIAQLQEYNVPGFTIGPGQHSQCVPVNSDPGSTIDDSQIQAQLTQMIAAGTVKASTENTLYVFMFPQGVVVTQQGSSSCTQFCAYHNTVNIDNFGGPFYAVQPYNDCLGCLVDTVLNATTRDLWHEIAEAITDPIPGTGWYDTVNGEIGDICEANLKVINQAEHQATVGVAAAGAAYTVTVNPTSFVADGTTPVQLTLSLTPQAAPPPPPPPPPTGQSWTVQALWSNINNKCV